MDFILYLCFFPFILLIYKLFFNQENRNLPPSPPARPILGHLHLLKKPFHRTLQSLAHQFGPVFHLRFGLRDVLIVSSPSAAEECFTTKDVVFANRPYCLVGQHLGHNYSDLGWASYGQHWRTLRRVTVTEIFSSSRVLTSSCYRALEIKFLIKQLLQREELDRKVDLKSTFFDLTINMMMQVVAGKPCFERDMEIKEKKRYREYLKETFLPNMSMSLGDFFPFLKWVGYLGLQKNVVELQVTRNKFLQGLIDENRSKKNDDLSEGQDLKTRTLLESLLCLQKSEPEYYTDEIIKGIVSILFTAGTDTSASIMEWAMSLLLNHPHVLKKARAEIDSHVERNRLLEDSDLPKLPFLHSIINETLRLFPAGPLLIPHASSEECTISGYNIPRGTILMVNAWAIHRDPKLWEEPDKFKPERFEGVEGERDGFRFIPFGTGRRGCPGAVLGTRTVALVLGTIIQCFEWERVGDEMMDMSESVRSSVPTLPKDKPLEAIFRPREAMLNLLSEL